MIKRWLRDKFSKSIPDTDQGKVRREKGNLYECKVTIRFNMGGKSLKLMELKPRGNARSRKEAEKIIIEQTYKNVVVGIGKTRRVYK
jgi:hypothetical protein